MDLDASRDSSPDICGDGDDDHLSSSGPPTSPRADSDMERPHSSTHLASNQSMSQSGSAGSPSPGLRYTQTNLICVILEIYIVIYFL